MRKLERILFDEHTLHRMQLAAARKAFDCQNLLSLGDERERQARMHSFAIDHHRASTAIGYCRIPSCFR